MQVLTAQEVFGLHVCRRRSVQLKGDWRPNRVKFRIFIVSQHEYVVLTLDRDTVNSNFMLGMIFAGFVAKNMRLCGTSQQPP